MKLFVLLKKEERYWQFSSLTRYDLILEREVPLEQRIIKPNDRKLETGYFVSDKCKYMLKYQTDNIDKTKITLQLPSLEESSVIGLLINQDIPENNVQ
jgi:hypothetical protein